MICGFFDSTAEAARQGGALHKTVARPAKTAYFGRRDASRFAPASGDSEKRMARIEAPITGEDITTIVLKQIIAERVHHG